jgi:hypothetical protein
MADYLSFSQPCTYQSASAKKAIVNRRASRSHIEKFSAAGAKMAGAQLSKLSSH